MILIKLKDEEKHWKRSADCNRYNVEILEAKQAINSWVKHNVYEKVEDSGQKVVSVRWVISLKFKEKKRSIRHI